MQVTKINQITKDTQIAEAVSMHPAVGEIFTRYGLHCVGCHVSPYESIEQGCLGHGMPSELINNMIDEVNNSLENNKFDEIIKITPFAIEKLKDLRNSKKFTHKWLRVTVKAGGCAGFSYDFSFETQKEDDKVIEQDGLKVFISKESVELIKGSTIDFVDSLQGAGIKIQNPNAKSTCGCGKSFA